MSDAAHRPAALPVLYDPSMRQREDAIRRAQRWGDDVRDLIIDRLSAGESLIEICRTPGYPAESTVRKWAVLDVPAGFGARYTRARESWADHQAEKIIELADAALPMSDFVAKAKLQIEARKWITSKLYKGRYGDKVDVAVDADVRVSVETIPDDELDARIARLASTLGVASPVQAPAATPTEDDA